MNHPDDTPKINQPSLIPNDHQAPAASSTTPHASPHPPDPSTFNQAPAATTQDTPSLTAATQNATAQNATAQNATAQNATAQNATAQDTPSLTAATQNATAQPVAEPQQEMIPEPLELVLNSTDSWCIHPNGERQSLSLDEWKANLHRLITARTDAKSEAVKDTQPTSEEE